jgi:hypothetical protein
VKFIDGKWRARVKIGGRMTLVGLFDTEAEAQAAYHAASDRLRPEFSSSE